MGCIVNSPGEPAVADFGYVGVAPGKITPYACQTAVKFHIPEAEAMDRFSDIMASKVLLEQCACCRSAPA